jgi:hypothetical protein
MKKLTILAALALSSQAMALDTTMNLKGRFDYVRTEGETKASASAATVKTSRGEYSPSFLQWETAAKFNDTVKANLILDFADSNTAAINVFSEFVDVASITKTIGNIELTIGKQAVQIGGRENQYSDRDLYLASAFSATNPNNQTGLSASYTFMDQMIVAQHLENQRTTETLKDKKSTGLAFYGKFLDGMVSPVASYHKVGTDIPGKYDIFTTVGVQVAAANIVFELDYLMLNKENGGTNASAQTADAELNSMVAHVRYAHENFKPFFKYIKEEGKGSFADLISTNSAVETERASWELGLEYTPSKDEDMNYHLVYNSSESKETSGTVKAVNEDKKLYAGVSFGFNILK